MDTANNPAPSTPRRRHRKPKDPMFGLRNALNIIFMVLAVVGVVVYLCADNSTIGVYIILAAMVFKMVECCIRMLH